MTDIPNPLLSVDEMYRADRAAAAAGVPSLELMEAAGAGVAGELLARFGVRPTVVLCGPGNNGGDGFVAARHLQAAGVPVRLALAGERARLKGDAAIMAERWSGAVEPLAESVLDGVELVVDALFGAGLQRAIAGAAGAVLRTAAERRMTSVAVDVPSGVDGDTGQVLGCALPAAMTVTFFRPKPGHLLLPGRTLCGELRVIDIGIPEAVLAAVEPRTNRNAPALWLGRYPWPQVGGHKYTRGHAVVASGPRAKTGAARLAARAALRIGAGLVTLASPDSAVAENAAQLTAIMLNGFDTGRDFAKLIADERRNAVLLGPGNGVCRLTRDNVLAALRRGKATVLDADAITVFADGREALFRAIRGLCVLTPHEGEFARLFPGEGGKLARARAAAAESGAVVLLKGADTVVAAPDGRAVVNDNAPPELATAGSGDVLGGFVVGLLSQGMDAFDAACAACWLHGEAAAAFGPGLIAEDLPEALPGVLRRLQSEAHRR